MRTANRTAEGLGVHLDRVAFRAPTEAGSEDQAVPRIVGFAKPRQEGEPAEILGVLARAAGDPRFAASLLQHGSKTLAEYSLSTPAKAALVSGDLKWLEEKVGKLTPELRSWVDCRLQCEAW